MTDDRRPSAPPPCPNCGAPVADRYCPRCGQRYELRLLSLRRMARDFLDDQFSLNGTLPRTLAALLFRPGFLTREYAAGRIVRYVRPFRLFLISSLLFFVALSFVTDPDILYRSAEEQGIDPEALARAEAEGRGEWNNVNLQIDSAAVPGWSRPLLRRIQAQQDRINALPPREALRVMVEGMIEAAAKVSFLMVPAFAALLMLLHVRRRRRYVEHFVFALHYHALAFLLLTVAIVASSTPVWWVVGGWLSVYLLVALKAAYAQPWWQAAIKLFVVLWTYPVLLGLGAGAASLLALALI